MQEACLPLLAVVCALRTGSGALVARVARDTGTCQLWCCVKEGACIDTPYLQITEDCCSQSVSLYSSIPVCSRAAAIASRPPMRTSSLLVYARWKTYEALTIADIACAGTLLSGVQVEGCVRRVVSRSQCRQALIFRRIRWCEAYLWGRLLG